jgi:hypothetical protein
VRFTIEKRLEQARERSLNLKVSYQNGFRLIVLVRGTANCERRAESGRALNEGSPNSQNWQSATNTDHFSSG